jgi:hypothetical protein
MDGIKQGTPSGWKVSATPTSDETRDLSLVKVRFFKIVFSNLFTLFDQTFVLFVARKFMSTRSGSFELR